MTPQPVAVKINHAVTVANDAPFVLFGQMTTADPTRSPAGTESAWAYTHLPRRVSLTEAQLDDHVALIEETIEKHAPGFRTSVLARHVQSPASLQQHDANLVDGAINGGTAQLHQQLVFRPVPGLGGPITPVETSLRSRSRRAMAVGVMVGTSCGWECARRTCDAGTTSCGG